MKTFKTKSGAELPLLDLHGKDYLQVAHRVVWFREEHPTWTIDTQVTINEKLAVGRARILDETGRLIATGTKCETPQGFSDYVEKSETGAVGRALALCGYGTQFTTDLDEGTRLADSPIAPKYIVNLNKNNNEFRGIEECFELTEDQSKGQLMELLKSEVDMSGDCWIWTGKKNHGYGYLFINHKTWSVHRLSYILEYGNFNKSLSVLHKCDNPACIKPQHLFLGTQQDNVNDAKVKGRLHQSPSFYKKTAVDINCQTVGKPSSALSKSSYAPPIENGGAYKFTFGMHKGKSVTAMATDEVKSYCGYLNKKITESGKSPSQNVMEAINAMEHELSVRSPEQLVDDVPHFDPKEYPVA